MHALLERLSGFLERTGPIILTALLLRLAAAALLPLSEEFAAQTDSGLTALNLVEGRGYIHDFYGRRPDNPLLAYMPPLHVLYVSLSLVFPDPPLAYATQQILLGTLAVFWVHRLAQGLGGPLTGGLAGWAMALYPTYVIMTAIPESVIPFMACMAAVLFLAWRLWQKPTLGRAALTGLVLGVLALGRPHALLLVPLLILWLALKHPPPSGLWRQAALLCLTVGLVIAPWLLRNWWVLKRPVMISTNGGRTFWLGNNPFTTGSGGDVFADRLAAYWGIERDPTWPDIIEYPGRYPLPHELEGRADAVSELELDRIFSQSAFDYVRSHPVEWLALEGRKLVSFWWFRPNLGANPQYDSRWTVFYQVIYAGVALLALIGLVLSARHWRRYGLLYGVLVTYTVVYLAFHVLTRYRWEIEFILLIFAALTVSSLWSTYLTAQHPTEIAKPAGARGV